MLFSEKNFINAHTHFKPGSPDEFIIRNGYLTLSAEHFSTLGYYVSAGLHPWHINKMSVNECGDKLIGLASNPHVLAIGEIGIDKAIEIPLKTQLDYFDAQLNIARAFQKPVIIHAVKSYNDLMPFLKKTKVPFIFHGFTGNEQQAKELLKYNCKLSFGKGVFDEKAQRVLNTIPNDAFLLETDAASALSIKDIYKKVAEIKALDLDALKSMVFHTFAPLIHTN